MKNVLLAFLSFLISTFRSRAVLELEILLLTFDGSGSYADEGIAEYFWDFGEFTHTLVKFL